MIRLMIEALVVIVVVILSAAQAHGIGSMMAPVKGGADPTAALLVEQGIKQFEEKNWEAAHTSFKFAAEIDPGFSIAYFNAGVVASEMGRMKEALSAFEAFASRNPGHPEGQRLLSDLKQAYSSGYQAVGGGFAEFGAASLLGLIFIFAVAAYDIGILHPFTEADGKPSEETEWKEEYWKKAA